MGGVSHEAQKKGLAGADGSGRLGMRKIRKQSLTVSPAGPEGLVLRGGLPTAQLGIEGHESLSLQ